MACVMWTTGVNMIPTVHFLEKWHPVGLSPPLGFAAIRHVMLLILQMLLFNASSFKFSQRLDPWANVFSICNHLSYLIYFLKRLNGIGLPLQCIQTEQFAAILKALFVFACAWKRFKIRSDLFVYDCVIETLGFFLWNEVKCKICTISDHFGGLCRDWHERKCIEGLPTFIKKVDIK